MSEPVKPLDGGAPSGGEHKTLRQMMGTESFREYINKVQHGLKQPQDSGEYKYARYQVFRVWSPIASVVLPIMMVLAVMLAPTAPPPPAFDFEVTVMDSTAVEELDDIKEIEPVTPPEEEIKPPDITEYDPSVPEEALVGGPSETAGPGAGPGPASTESGDYFSPQPAAFDSVSMIKSPIKMTGIFGSRTPGARGTALGRYGGGGGGGAGGLATEHAVYLALRWLKKNQNSDGSWEKVKPAMTGLGLLTFLAHGETPESEEFGPTVERAIKWLIDNQGADGMFAGRDEHNYSHPIAAYALCEAFVLTKIPMVKTAAEKAIDLIIKGQNAAGGWDYNMKPSARDDTSYMGWCAQALKAAKLCGIENEGLEPAMMKAVLGFKKNYGVNANGGYFGYTEPADHGLTGTGALCLQLLGASKSQEVRESLRGLQRATCNWEGGGTYNQNYYWYYITQAKFHEGGAAWNAWNKLFSPTLVKNQTVISKAIEDAKGNLVDIGFWDMTKELSGYTDGAVMNTCLATLQLQVYYRYLPTFKTLDDVEEAPSSLSDEDKDVNIKVL